MPAVDDIGFVPDAPAQFETRLTPAEETTFQQWKSRYAPNDSGSDYDLRGAFKAGLTPGSNGHWPDTFKKPNHPTFSDESIYAAQGKPGHWKGEQFTPPKDDFGFVPDPVKPSYQFGIPPLPPAPQGPSTPEPGLSLADQTKGAMKTIGRIGQSIPAGLADISTALTTAPGTDIPKPNLLSVWQDEKPDFKTHDLASFYPNEPVKRNIARFSSQLANTTLESIPKLAATMASGPAASVTGAALFGFDDDGNFHPDQAVIAAALPLVGKAGGGLVEKFGGPLAAKLAAKFGSDPKVVLTWMKAGGQYLAANSLLAAQSVRDISKLPPEQRPDAIIDAAANIASMGILGLADFHAAGEQSAQLKAHKDFADSMVAARKDKAGVSVPDLDIFATPTVDLTKPTGEPNAVNPLEKPQGGEQKYSGTAQRPAVQPDTTEVRGEEGAGPSSSNRPVGAAEGGTPPAQEALTVPKQAESETGFTFNPTSQFGGMSTEGVPLEMVAQLPKQWEFTDRRKGSPTEGMTFYVTEGSTVDQIKNRYQEKLAEKSASAKEVVPVEEKTQEKEGVLTPAAAPETVSAVQKYRVGASPQTHTLVERLPASETEIANGEQPVRVKNDKTGDIQTVMESDLTPVKTLTAEEKKPRTTTKDLNEQLLKAGMEPSMFENSQQRRDALKRWRAKQASISGVEAPPENKLIEGSAQGIPEIRKLISSSGLPPQAVRVADAMLNSRVMRNLNWDNLRLEITPGAEEYAGEAWVKDSLIRLSGLADQRTFPHELFHFLWHLLPHEYQIAVETARLSSLKARFGDAIPEAFLKGMTSDQFIAGGHDAADYRLINPSEFLSEFAGDKADELAKRLFDERHDQPEGFWKNLVASVKDWVKGIVNAVKRVRKVAPDMESIYNALLDGKWTSTPEGVGEERQASLSAREYQKRKAFGERDVERTIGFASDVAEMKKRAADALDASPEARKIARVDQHEALSSLASTDAQYAVQALGNYREMRARTEGSDMGLRSGVIIDAWRGHILEQNRTIKLRRQFADQEALVKSPAFMEKVGVVMNRALVADLAKETSDTFNNQVSVEIGKVAKQMREMDRNDARYEQAQADLKNLQKLGSYDAAVQQRIQEMVDLLWNTEEGYNLLWQGGDKTGGKLAKFYLDIKDSIARTGQKPLGMKSMVDPALLSPSDRAEVERFNLPTSTPQDKAFVNLAAQVLAANHELGRKLVNLANLRDNPQFKADVTAAGEKFRKSFAADPVNAIKQVAKTASRLKGRAMDAEAAWLRLNRKIAPELARYENLRQAVAIDDAVQNSPEWRQLLNDIQQDAGAIRIPDSELSRLTSDTAWNEITGIQTLHTPNGNEHNIYLGFTKRDAEAAQSQMSAYLGEVNAWLDDPKNADSPDRAYWQQKYDFVDNVLNVSTALAPTGIRSFGIQSAFNTPEFFFKNARLPQAKITFTASNNHSRAWVVADQWYNGAMPDMIRTLRKGMDSHNRPRSLASPFPAKTYDANGNGFAEYRRDVLDRLATEYRQGRALKAGDRLNNGITLTQADIAAFREQGRRTKELFDVQKNLGRERVMPDHLILDEWAKNVFGLRAPQELGAEPGTTLPHEFSDRAKNLAQAWADLKGADPKALLDEPENFNEFVKRFIAERRADYSTPTPFEDIYRQLADKWREGDPDAPKNIDEIVDFLDANTPAEYDRAGLEKFLVGDMASQISNFHRQFMERENQPSDVRALRATRDSAFTKGFHKDVGSSFFYDYGAITAPEIRSMGIDSTNFHLVRYARSLDNLVKEYDKAISKLPKYGDVAAQTEAMMAGFRNGEDFRNWERLRAERKQAEWFRSNLSGVYGSSSAPSLDLFSNLKRLQSDFIKATLSGATTMMNIYVGSVNKTGNVLGGMERASVGSYARAAVNTLRAILQSAPNPLTVAGKVISKTVAGKGLDNAFIEALNEWTEATYKKGEYFRQQYDYGLGAQNPVGTKIANMLAMPYSHGMGYDPKLTKIPGFGMVQKAAYRMLSVVEAPLELINAWFPQMGYVAAYDAAARTAGATVDGIAAQARRSFDYLEKTGGLAKYDLNDTHSLKNILPADYVLPGFAATKGQTQLNMARDWWQRAIDVPLNEMVLNYWKKLAATPPAERDKVSFLASDITDPAKVDHFEKARAGALMSILLKDVHHASPENRPWELRKNPLLTAFAPMLGWTSQTTLSTLQSMGRAHTSPTETQTRLKMLAATTILGMTVMAIVNGEVEKEVKKLFSKFVLHEETPIKTINRADNLKEAAKIALVDIPSFIPFLHSLAAEMTSQTQSAGIQFYTIAKLNSLLDYVKGVIHTGDPTYGLAALSKNWLPFSKPFINQMESQKGLIASRNAITLAKLYAPEGIPTRGPQVIHEAGPLSAIRQDLASAVFSGDSGGVKIASAQYLAKAIEMGKTPEEAQRMLAQTMGGMNFYQQAWGVKPTAQQVAEFKAKLTPEELAQVNTAETNWNNAVAAVGGPASIVKGMAGGSGGGMTVKPFSAPKLRFRGARAVRSRSGSRVSSPRLRSIRNSGGGLPHGHRVAKLRAPRVSSSRRPRTSRLRRRRTVVA